MSIIVEERRTVIRRGGALILVTENVIPGNERYAIALRHLFYRGGNGLKVQPMPTGNGQVVLTNTFCEEARQGLVILNHRAKD